jgi:hypothetical protein
MKISRTDFKVHATPFFSDVACPVHRNYMKELQNGWFGNPVWWCKDCKKVYQLELREIKNPNMEAVNKQLQAIKDNK